MKNNRKTRVSETIVRAQDRETLFQQAGLIAVEDGGFRMAWVRVSDPEAGLVRVMARYGHDAGYLENLSIRLTDVAASQGPTGVAIREGGLDLCNDFATEPRMAPWREKALERGYRSSAAFPLRLGETMVGALNLCADRPWFFN